jgi:hypothetical protein
LCGATACQRDSNNQGRDGAYPKTSAVQNPYLCGIRGASRKSGSQPLREYKKDDCRRIGQIAEFCGLKPLRIKLMTPEV